MGSTDTFDGATYLQRLGLERLGVDAEAPSVEALFAIHRAHVERVPYETLWIQLGEGWTIEPRSSSARIAGDRRGGYCFHLNGALSELLGALGYHVTRHVGGVHGPDGSRDAEMTNHLVLMVHDLPSEGNPSGTWYVDAGLGDAPHEPLPLVAGEYRQGPFDLVLAETPGGVGDWHLTHDPKGSFTGMAWRTAPTGMEAFTERHVWLSTSPESGFVKVLTVQRRDAAGVDILRGLTPEADRERPGRAHLETATELSAALGDLFGLDVDVMGDQVLAGLWAKVHRAHLAWEAAGRPSLDGSDA